MMSAYERDAAFFSWINNLIRSLVVFEVADCCCCFVGGDDSVNADRFDESVGQR